MEDEQLLRYSRQIMLPEIDMDGQLRLAKSQVLIIGLGGLGSPLSIYLTTAGVGTLVLVDYDVVAISNLQRQILYREADIGKSKVQIAKQHLQALNTNTRLLTIERALEKEELDEQVAAADVVADASDNFATRFAVNASCVRMRTPLVSAAAIRFEGQISVFDPAAADSPCYRCLYDEDSHTDESCTANGVAAPLLGVLGSLQAMEVMKIVTGKGTTLRGKLLLVDLFHADMQFAELLRDPACPVCAEHPATG